MSVVGTVLRLSRPLYDPNPWHWHAGEPYVCHWDSIVWCGRMRHARDAPMIDWWHE